MYLNALNWTLSVTSTFTLDPLKLQTRKFRNLNSIIPLEDIDVEETLIERIRYKSYFIAEFSLKMTKNSTKNPRESMYAIYHPNAFTR